jgi:hypothetical protein
VGTIIFVDFWLSHRLGFQPAAGVPIDFVSLPGWFIAVLSYTLLSRTLQQPAAHLAAVATLGNVERP